MSIMKNRTEPGIPHYLVLIWKRTKPGTPLIKTVLNGDPYIIIKLIDKHLSKRVFQFFYKDSFMIVRSCQSLAKLKIATQLQNKSRKLQHKV